MMKYFKHIETIKGVTCTRYFQPEGTNMCIPEAEDNTDYSRMMEGVDADPPTNTIEEVDDTPE
jgi:hypothetical protein